MAVENKLTSTLFLPLETAYYREPFINCVCWKFCPVNTEIQLCSEVKVKSVIALAMHMRIFLRQQSK